MPSAPTATIGLGPLRPAPPGLPDPNLRPPTVGESGDPFTSLRVIDLVARGRQALLRDYAESVVRQSLTASART